ncbi:PTS sugar transporter subunit IIA [Thermophilibacter provencensis]|uniref:PTS sugar transporter subunit IIA n=1 Tax=Thermophilibacter provencensis TaxID=1852386 RepID=A0A921GCM0_9ACTN|nr:PTS sugar transporter subunit IIA [Thermophilibacter provencensis]HJF44295.1 PTS sugar transporter subunit IIA [Thermophilibacter provencensis]
MGKLLDERLVFIDADVHTSEEAIRLMAGRLQECGYVEEGYAEMVIEREKVFPTGLPGKAMSIAIPHTDPTLVNKPAIGVIVPSESVEFDMMGEPGTKLDVKLIMPLVIKNSDQQIELLKAMMHVIQDSERLTKIRASKDRAEILDLLSELEEAVG